MEDIFEKIDDICPQNQSCTNKDCPLMHPRCFTGICIYHLQKQKHNESACKNLLRPTKLKEVKQQLQQSINGVFLINLCPLAEGCTNKKSCGFLHRDWFDEQKLCFANLSDDCEQGRQCKRNHKSWRQLQMEVQEKFQYLNLDAERLCLVKECKCKNHNEILKGFCLEYFVGACKVKGQCSKIHVDWEQIKFVKKEQYVNKQINPCTFKNTNQIYYENTKFWNRLELLLNKNVINKIIQNVKDKNVIDVVILMDCTGSMRSWIESARNNILDIISSFQKSVPQTLIRVAFIGYRDFCDKEKKIEYHDFTSDINSIKQFIGSLKADGGGDGAEDISGALEFALKLDYSKHPDAILCTYLVCDAPTHGKQYHDIKSDDLIDKIPDNQLEKIMEQLNSLKTNNYFFCYKITKICDKMFNIMKQSFKDLEIVECKNIGQFPESVKQSLFESYTKSQMRIQQPTLSKKIRIKAHFVKHFPFQQIKKDSKGNTLNFKSNFLNQYGTNQIDGETVLEIDLEPFKSQNDAEGKSSIIFKVLDLRYNKNLVVKFQKSQFDSAKQNTKNIDLIEKAEKSSKVRYFQTMIAKMLACEFRNDTKNNQKAPPIFYPTPIKYELFDDFYQVRNLYAETDIKLNSKWEKISNNSDYLNQEKKAYATFSHYTYEITDGQLLITDLQGRGGILSDPSIHTTHKNLEELLQDPMNCHKEGIEGFSNFQHKQCNELCKQLNLTRQRFTSELTDDESTIEGTTVSIKNKGEKIDKIKNISIKEVNCVCDLCGEIYVLEYKKYLENNQFYFHCQKCCQEIQIADICKCCGNEFSYNQNQTIRLGYQPTQCNNCKASCQQKDIKCYYCETACMLREISLVTIGDSSNYICKVSQQFFETIYCSDCKEPFSYQQWPTKDEYTSQKYVCYCCKKQKE